jgi:hypothetical protein
MTAASNKIDSNSTGLRYVEEASLRVLPGAPVWLPLEPNSYSNFGAKITTVARAPIVADRSQRKGVVTDVDANADFNQDLTLTNTFKLMQGLLFADAVEPVCTAPLNGTQVALTTVTGATKTIAAAAGLGNFKVSAIVLASGFSVAGNNGIKTIATAAAGAVTVNEALVDEVPPVGAALETVGHQGAAGDLAFSYAAGVAKITSTALDFTTLTSCKPGAWIYLGGDTGPTSFVNNGGFARISAVAAGALTLDKTDWTPVTEAGAGKTIQFFVGKTVMNQTLAANIKRRTYQLERTLGVDTVGTMSEYIVGAFLDSMTLNVPQANKVTCDFKFMGLDAEQRTGATGLKAGTRPAAALAPAFNTSSDFSRIKLAVLDATQTLDPSLVAFVTDAKVTVANNGAINKAVAALGGIDTSVGNLQMSGTLTAYFADVATVAAVRNNADVTLDIIAFKNNTGIVFDIPLMGLGNGVLNVVKDKAIDLPLDMMGAMSAFGHTVLIQQFSYLPNNTN